MNKSKAIVVLATVVAIVSLVAGCAGGDGDTLPTAEVSRGTVRATVSVSGNLNAPDDQYAAFKMPGTVVDVRVEKGDTVRAGDVLAKLDTKDFERNVSLARTSIKQAQLQYDIADEQLRNTIYPHYYSSYVVDVPGTWMALDKATENVQEARALMDAGDTAEANLLLDDVLSDIADAQSSTEARKWDLPFAVKVMELQREAASVAVDAAKLNLESALEALDDASLTAPISGVVTAVLVKEGDTLTSMNYSNPAFHIIDSSNLEMTGLIDEMDIAEISTGQKAIVTLDALPGTEVAGSVTYISDAAMIEAGVVMYETTVTLQNAGSSVKDGMSATADIVMDEKENVLVIPTTAVMRGESGEDIVYLVNAEGETVAQPITTGMRSGRIVEILSGLSEGDVIALEPPK
jgi:HlyD family secretion protein